MNIDEILSKLLEENQRLLAELSQAKKQKPVGWWNGKQTTWLSPQGPMGDCTIPLYASPPLRDWVGLTMEDVAELWEDYDESSWYAFFRAIEAKLKEKNHVD